MKIAQTQLIADLKSRTQANLKDAQVLSKMSAAELNAKASPEKWSALECLEHLNRYGDFYIPEITRRIQTASKTTGNDYFKSGFLGNKFAKMMLPGAKGMKTFDTMNPANSSRTIADLEKFIAQQNELLALINECANYDLSKIKTSISISKLIKLRLGDSLRVVIYHNNRHMLQALNAAKKQD